MRPDIGNMKILAFDTSWDFGVVSTVVGMKIVEKFCGRSPRVASEGLLPWIMEVTSRSGWKQEDIDLVAVGRGPGSFTGTRVAVTVAKAMAEVLDVPLVSVSSVDPIALTVGRPGQRVAVVMDARKGEVMAALYAVSAPQAGGGPLSEYPEASVLREPALMSPAHARELLEIGAAAGSPLVACGDGFIRYADFFSGGVSPVRGADEGSLMDPMAIAALALRRFLKGGRDDPAALEPVYLRL
jgi:tRNA threonylcarbamoyladenosine biosynthesis protein TsaB